MYQQGDFLIARLRANPDDRVANELLDEFHGGYPADRLRDLLESDDADLVRIGAWIASELGAKIVPLLADLANLAGHSQRYVRFYAIEAIAASGANDGRAHAVVLRAIWDEDEAIRWKTMRVLVRLSRAQIESALPYLLTNAEKELARWLVECDDRVESELIVRRLETGTREGRLVAAVAAARMANRTLRPLQCAAISEDMEVQSFALELLKEIG